MKCIRHLFFVLVSVVFVVSLAACGGGGSDSGAGGGPDTWPGNYFGDFNVRVCDNMGVCDTSSIPAELVVFSDNSIQFNVDGSPGSRSDPNTIDAAGNFGVPEVVIDFSVDGQGTCRFLMNLSGNVNGSVATMIGGMSLTCPNGTVAGDYNFSGIKGAAKAWSQERLDRERKKLSDMFR